jgi:tRNA-(ms[2]io[6]A)-hydroxylase
MLGLQVSTGRSWVAAAGQNVESILVDHAHCERKAATMALSLINRYPERTELVQAMVDLAREEMEHFQQVHFQITSRGYRLTHDPGDEYVQKLHQEIRKQEPGRLLDTLLVSSLVEARSCERFKLLAESIDDAGLSHFYASLVRSEASHRTLFVDLARRYFNRNIVNARLEALALREAEIVSELAGFALMHG